MVGGFASYRRHLIPLGAAAARVRSEYEIPGSRAARSFLLAAMLWPARMGQMTWRVMRYGQRQRMRFVVLLPGIVAGLMLWNWGFLRYLREPNMLDLQPEVDRDAVAASEMKDRVGR
jgi:hypothetical protein